MNICASMAIYEIDGSDVGGADPHLEVGSHWNKTGHDGFVVLKLPDGHSYTVATRSLKEAVERCTGFSR